jgi:hypothetical protein
MMSVLAIRTVVRDLTGASKTSGVSIRRGSRSWCDSCPTEAGTGTVAGRMASLLAVYVRCGSGTGGA